MRTNYLFAHKYKKIGWALGAMSLVVAAIYLWQDCNAEYSIIDEWLDELTLVLSTLAMVLIGFSAEADEDECILSLRMKSLMWAVKVYAVVFIAGVVSIYGFGFIYFLSSQVLILLLIYIIKFHYELYKFRKEDHEE